MVVPSLVHYTVSSIAYNYIFYVITHLLCNNSLLNIAHGCYLNLRTPARAHLSYIAHVLYPQAQLL